MAKAKVSLPQRDFSLGEVREEFLESDGVEVRMRSARKVRNLRPIAGRALTDRWGSYKEASIGTDTLVAMREIEPVEGEFYLLKFKSGGLDIYNTSGTVVKTFSGAPWTTDPWIVPARENTYIGGKTHEIYVLNYDGTTWTLGVMAFSTSTGGALAQPYYAFNKGVTLTPSALSGTGITLTASSSVFTSSYVGVRLRYHGKEITITGYTSGTVLTGDVVTELPPSFDIVVNDASGFETEEIVVGVSSGYQGLVVGVDTATNTLQVITLQHYEGPDATTPEELAGPNTVSKVSSVTAAAAPYGSIDWEEPLMSPVRQYPQAATIVAGRLVLCDFPSVPDIIALSSNRSLRDFESGLDDDDAIIRTVGNGQSRIRHVVDAGDLLIFTDVGSYFVLGRDGVPITPSNFTAVRFDERGANAIQPEIIGSTILFVSESGEELMAAVLDGSVYLKWTIVVVSRNHNHLINSPIDISISPRTIANDDRMMFVVNSDGSTVAVRWDDDIAFAGLFPWENLSTPVTLSPPATGQFIGKTKAITAFNGEYWQIVERAFDGTSVRYLEKLSESAWMDFCEDHTGGSSVSLSHYNGAPISVRVGDNFVGEYSSYSDVEAIILAGSSSDTYQIGVAWESYVQPWPMEFINSPRLGMIRARTIRIAVSVQDTISYFVRRNNTTSVVEAYGFGDDLSAPPPRKTHVRRFPVLGNRDHPEIDIGKNQPGPFTLLSYIAEVQA